MSSNKPKTIPVSELFDNLVVEYRAGGPPHSVLFQTALRVCAEDSKRVQRGEPPSSLRALAQRAHGLIKEAYPNSAPASMAAAAAQPPAESAPVRVAGRPPSSPPFAVDAGPAAAPIPPPPTAGRSAEAPAAAAPPQPPSPPDDGPFDHAPAPPPPPHPPTVLTLDDAPPPERPRPAAPPPVPTLTVEDILPAQDTLGEPHPATAEHRVLRSLGRVATIALGILAAAIAIVILWPGVARRKAVPARIVESFPAPTPTVAGADLAAALRAPGPPAAAAVPATPAPQPTPAPTPRPAEPRSAAPTPRPHRPAPAEADGGAETMRSPDWRGRQAVFVVHFSSYRNRENAVSDAARLARELGRPAHAVVVELGDRGTWYRVVVGEFATLAEARAFRAEIAASRPTEVSSVFRLAAP